jgi:hypothetical protein
MAKALCLGVILAVASWGAAQEDASATPQSPNDAASLQSYLASMLRAQQAGDATTVQTLADGLRLSDATQWFGSVFGPDQASAMSGKYDQSFLHFRSRLVRSFTWANAATADLSVELLTNPPKPVSVPSPVPQPRIPTEIASFKFVLRAQGKGRTEWVDSYVRVNDRLKYIGGGAFPFWVPLSIVVKKAN